MSHVHAKSYKVLFVELLVLCIPIACSHGHVDMDDVCSIKNIKCCRTHPFKLHIMLDMLLLTQCHMR